MIKLMKNARLVFCLVLMAACITACGPPETITETISEAEFQQEEFLCLDLGLNVDFQPGKIVCSGYLEGEQVVAEIIPKIEAGMMYFQILRITVQGEERSLDDFAEMNSELAQESTITPDEGYAITSITIADNELTITQNIE